MKFGKYIIYMVLAIVLLFLLLLAYWEIETDFLQEEANMMAEAYAQDIIDRTCFWDWKYEFSEQVGNYTAPEGYNFVVCTIHLQNNEFGPIFTEPGNWKLTAGGVSHNHDIATYSDEISYHSMHDWPGQVIDDWYGEEICGWTGEEVDDWTEEEVDDWYEEKLDDFYEEKLDNWDVKDIETQIVYLVQTNRSVQELNCVVDYPTTYRVIGIIIAIWTLQHSHLILTGNTNSLIG